MCCFCQQAIIVTSCAVQGSDIDIRIKWPNDIYSNDMKIGGILCHSTYRAKEFQVVIGVGLNLDNSHPTTCVNDVLKQQHTHLQLQTKLETITREVMIRAKRIRSHECWAAMCMLAAFASICLSKLIPPVCIKQVPPQSFALKSLLTFNVYCIQSNFLTVTSWQSTVYKDLSALHVLYKWFRIAYN